MALIRVDWNPSDKKIRQFSGLLLIFALFAAGLAWRKGNIAAAVPLAAAGIITGSLCAAWLSAGRNLYRAWMAVAFIIGSIISSVLLFVLYYGVITPLGLLFRMMSRDALGLRGAAESYWVPLQIPDEKEYFEKLY